jgi:exopolysaccharide production protein ExoZ
MAALMVVYFHSILQLRNFGVTVTILPVAGETGVDIFFVLSGFLMWTTTVGKKVSAASFILKRLLRIVPLYWMLTIIAGVAAVIAPHLLRNTVYETSHFISSLAFFPQLNPAYINSADETLRITPLLVPGWTLNYEMFFYLIFAIALFFTQSLRLFIIAFLMAAVALFSLISDSTIPALVFYSNIIISEFLMGIGVAIIVKRLWLVKVRWALLTIFIATAMIFLGNYKGLELNRAIIAGIPAAFIIYSLCCIEILTKPKKLTYMHLIGDASYSIYLTHVFTLVICRIIFQHFYKTHNFKIELIFVALCLISSLITGVTVYFLYEKPVADWLGKSKLKPMSRANAKS